jgi:4-amino-4-deoxy-L-arabinose transferase-like glycosyltransferase
MIFIFLLALLVRLAFVHYFWHPPVMDQRWNDAVGWNLAQGYGFSVRPAPPYTPGLYRGPGYPYFLAAVYALAGHSFKAAFIAQAIVDSVTALLVVAIASAFFGTEVSLLAGFLYALYPYSSIFCGIIIQDVLLTFMVTLVLWLAVRAARDKENWVGWVAVGVGLGFAALVKPFLILYAAVPAVTLIVIAPWRKALKNLVLLSAASVAIISPWVIRNYVAFHAFPPLAMGGTGTNLALLIREIEVGDRAILQEQAAAPPVSLDQYAYQRDFSDGKELMAQQSAAARAALPELRRLWRQYLLLIASHIPLLWITRYAIFDHTFVAFAATIVSLLVLLPGLLGMWLMRASWRRLMPLYATVILITLFYAPYTLEARYTLPARPAMIIFVSGAAFSVFTFLRGRRNQAVRVAARTA